MRGVRLLLAVLIVLAAAGCARQQRAYYTTDPTTGQLVAVVAQQQLYGPAQYQYAQPQYAQPQHTQRGLAQPVQTAAARPATQANGRGLYSPSAAYAQQSYEQPAFTASVTTSPAMQSAATASASAGRGLFTSRNIFKSRSAPAYAAAPAYRAPATTASATGGPYVVPGQNAYAAVPPFYQEPYTLDSGDRLRIVVFGQDGITNSYFVGADGHVNLPLIGMVPARGYTTEELSKMIAERLRQGYVREPHVSVEVEVYRPFFILGEVTTPGQYPYVANMTAETAVAIAGGFSPRANKNSVLLTRTLPGQQVRGNVPLNYPVRPGDTIAVKERWF